MDDYKILMRELLLQYYDPTPEGEAVQMQTSEVLRWLRGIIPNDPIDEHDTYDVLKEIGFTQSQKIIRKKVCTFEGNKKAGIAPEFEEREIARILVWNLYEK